MKVNIWSLMIVIFVLSGTNIQAQDYWFKKPENYKVKPIFAVQMWGVYTTEEKVYNAETLSYEEVGDRFNLMLRRSRFGFSANPLENLTITGIIAVDMVGRDALSAVVGPVNNGSSPTLRLWDFTGQWKISKNNESLHLIFGYFLPQFSRVSITSPFNVASMEKSFSQNYIRKHLVGYGSGRAAGLNLGGLLLNEDKHLGLNYALGVFNPLSTSLSGNSIGVNNVSLLYTARTVLYIGDPEMKKYGKGHKTNYMNERKGISIGGNVSYQGKTELFESSTAAGVDVLFNWGAWNLDGEWLWMSRSGEEDIVTNGVRPFDYNYTTGHFRFGYNMILQNKYFIQPAFMVKFFNGALDEAGQSDAAMVGAFSGIDNTYDAGINWFLNKNNLMVKLHYVWRQGDRGEAPAGAKINNYFNQSGVGAIYRGNYLAIGLEAKL